MTKNSKFAPFFGRMRRERLDPSHRAEVYWDRFKKADPKTQAMMRRWVVVAPGFLDEDGLTLNELIRLYKTEGAPKMPTPVSFDEPDLKILHDQIMQMGNYQE